MIQNKSMLHTDNNLLSEIRQLIDSSKAQVAIAVNSTMTLLYWHIGERINREILGGERVAYGKQIVATLARQLTEEYGGHEFSEKNLNRMRLFASRFQDMSNWTPLASKLSWSHFLQVIPIIIEMGNDFAFMARQKRITVDDEDYYIDLLFYHRRLRCLVAIDLKLGKFQAAYKGQMELYLHWLEKYEIVEGENKPIGLILCAGKNEEHIELMHLKESNIRVAEYLTILPDKHLLESKLKQTILHAKSRLGKTK